MKNSKPIEGMDYYIRFITLPQSIHGMTVRDRDGFYNIYINDRQSVDAQQRAIDHEINHIRSGDFDNISVPLEIIEK